MKLAIISHTPHYEKEKKIVGWGSTIREINYLTEIFDEIYHLAPLHNEKAPEGSLPYDNRKIVFIPLKPYGGKNLINKLSIITTAPNNLKIVKSILNKVDWVQFRAPTAMGLYILPYLSMRSKPKRWVKYAGNWNTKIAPISYRFQKWLLKNNFQKSKVTINGYWEGQKDHIINFQNPCLDNTELIRAKKIALEKNFNGELVLCFVGTLTRNKGVDLILEALKKIEHNIGIKEVILVGDGPEKKRYESIASDINFPITFKGFLSRNELENIYEVSHIILLPSESEGFPKVIAEAAAYGCIPIVSNVSSISQYFNDTNGFLLKDINAEALSLSILESLKNRNRLKDFSIKCTEVASLFTFEYYNKRLLNEIINNENSEIDE